MSLASATNRNDYTGNGATATYSYTFRIFEDSDLLVTTVDTDGVETELTLTTDYTVSGAGDASGGSITLVAGNLTSGYGITIRRVRPLTQTTDIRNQGDFYPETHEDAFDHMVMISQQQQDELDRSAKNAETVSSSDFDPTLPADMVGEENVVLMTNAAGDGFATGPSAAEISAATSYTLFRNYVEYDDTDSPVTLGVGVAGYLVLCDCSSGAISVTLPTISAMTVRGAIAFRKTDSTANALTINRGGTDTIESGTSTVINSHDTGLILCPDATSNWEVGGNWFGEANSHSLCRSYDAYNDTDSPVTLTNDDAGKLILCDCTSGAITINLPTIANMSTVGGIAVKKTDTSTNAVTVSPGGADTIDAGASATISSPDTTIMLVPNVAATNWANIGSQLGSDPILEGTGSVTVPKGTTAQRPASGVAGMFRYNTDSSAFEGYTGSWGSIGGSSGGQNYFSNPDLEAGVSGFNTFADGAVTVPGDMDGAGATISISQEETDFIRGAASLLITKSGDCQGDGVVTDTITLDPADRGNLLSYSFEYWTDDSDFDPAFITVWAYDITNSAFMAVTPNTLSGGPNSFHKFSGVFQVPADTETMRLGIFLPDSEATDWTLVLDNFYCGPQLAASRGVPVTDWVAYTPGSSWTTNTTPTGFYRRVGDTLEVRFQLALGGAPDAAALTIDIPSGLTIDTAKIYGSTSWGPLGQVVAQDATDVPFYGPISYADTNSVYALYVHNNDGAGRATYIAAVNQATTVPCSFTSGDYVRGHFSVPIVGWGSNCVMSSDSDAGRVVAARYTCANADALAHDTTAKLCFDTKSFDTHSATSFTDFATADWAYTAPVSGYYKVSAAVRVESWTASAANYVIFSLYKNNAQYSVLQWFTKEANQADSSIGYQGTDTVYLDAGDYIDIRFYQNNTTSDSAALVSNANYNYVTIERISGPSTIMASETVACEYSKTAGNHGTSGSDETIGGWTLVKDTHNAMNTTSGIYTCPVAGWYQINMYLGWDSADASLTYGLLHRDAVQLAATTFEASVGTYSVVGPVSTVTYCDAGDTLYAKAHQASGGARAYSTATRISIARIGI